MSTEIKNRLKKIVDYAKYNGIAPTQKELGEKLGFTSEQYTSKLFSGNAGSYAEFAQKVKRLIPNLNTEWLLTGVGDMLVSASSPPQNNQSGVGNTNIQGSNIHDVNSAAAINRLADEMKAQREMYSALLKEKDTQINKLLEIIASK